MVRQLVCGLHYSKYAYSLFPQLLTITDDTILLVKTEKVRRNEIMGVKI